MKKTFKFNKKWIFILSEIVFCMSLVCGYSNLANAQEYSNSRTLNSLSNTYGSADKTYGEVYSDILKIGEKTVSFKILLNPEVYTDGIIQIDNQEIPINPELAETVGYAHGKATTYDFTNDGNEEIALVISGGASGAVQAVQVFANNDGKWNEINIPSNIYSNIPMFFKKQLKKLDIKIDDSIVYYRSFSFEKGNILITYHLFANSGTTPIVNIQKELFYSSDKKSFVLGDTWVIPASKNHCIITAVVNKRAITVKWIAGVEKYFIKGVQIKAATKKNMKGAKTYEFDKKMAQKMSYKFTVKSGKITENTNYYFKVRLKVGKKWTKWSNVKSSKIN